MTEIVTRVWTQCLVRPLCLLRSNHFTYTRVTFVTSLDDDESWTPNLYSKGQRLRTFKRSLGVQT